MLRVGEPEAPGVGGCFRERVGRGSPRHTRLRRQRLRSRPGHGCDTSTGDPVQRDHSLAEPLFSVAGAGSDREDRAEKAGCRRPGLKTRAERSGVSPTGGGWALKAPHRGVL